MKRNTLPLAALLTIACGGVDEGPAPASPDTTTAEYAVLVRGTLFTDDLAAARDRHDPLASGGEAMAKAAGDFAHDVGLGTGLFQSTDPHGFLAVDRWTDAGGMQSFYANPDFASGFATLFSAPPVVEQFSRQTDYHGWGDLDAGEGGDRWFVVVRGRLAADTPEARKAAHDQAAQGGESMVRAAGDVAHAVYLGLQDDREFLAFDVWTSSTAIPQVYGNPDFQAAFQTLFSAPPSLQVYRISDWHQW
jgi:quinol monooxygenase YgiN